MRRLLLLFSLLAVAVLAALIVYIEFFSTRDRAFSGPMSAVVPEHVAGWQSRDIPLAQTDGMLEHVNKVLRFDDFAQRLYGKPGLEVLVYAAYWGPGKVTTADAGTHNPDSCWVNAGWARHDRKYGQSVSIGGRSLRPYEFGDYSYSGKHQQVIFWHLVQGEPARYESQQTGWRDGLAGRIERLPLVLEDIRRYGLNQKREQVFVRISIAGKSPEEAMRDPDFVRLMHSLEGLGIFTDRVWR